jgi:hypothetical protein
MKRSTLLVLLLCACVDHKSIGMAPLETSSDTSSSSSASAELESSSADDHTTMPSSGAPETTGDVDEIDVCEDHVSSGVLAHTEACGDLSFVGVAGFEVASEDIPGLTFAIRVPAMIGMPFDEQGLVTADFELPAEGVEVRAFLAGDVSCSPTGDYEVQSYEMHAVSGALHIELIDRPTVGCIFTCDDAYALLTDTFFLPDTCEMDAPGYQVPWLELWGDVLPD